MNDQFTASLVKEIPTQAWTDLENSRRMRAPEFLDN